MDDAQVLSNVIAKALNAGVEGLILKDITGPYVPGKRQWLKIKKDYLYEGKYVDTADLVVLGAWFGNDHEANLMTRFLMGCYDEDNGVFCTVTQVSGSFSEDVIQKINKDLENKMVQIDQDPNKCPLWLVCSTLMVPDLVARDPRNQPVWEVTAAEFTQHEVHTAEGISMRFPKVTRIRDDKSWADATTLNELKVLVAMSSKKSVFQMLQGTESVNDCDKKSQQEQGSSSPKKRNRQDRESQYEYEPQDHHRQRKHRRTHDDYYYEDY